MDMATPQRLGRMPRFTSAFLILTLGSGGAVAQLENFSPRAALEDLSSAPLQLQADAIHSDNALRKPTNKTDDTLVAAGLAGAYTRSGPRVDLRIKSNLEYLVYLRGSYPSQLTGFFDGAALWGKPAQLLQWLVRETYAQLQGQPGVVTTPQNLDRVNSLMTGPALNFSLAPARRLTFYGLYAKITSSRSDLSGNRVQGGFALVQAFSANARGSLNGTVDDVKYTNSLQPNYRSESGFIRFERCGARTALTSDLGYTVLHEGATSERGPLVRLDLTRRISAASRVDFNLSQSLTSSTAALATTESEPGPNGVGRGLALTDPFKVRTAGLGWKTVFPRTELSADGSWSDEHYVLQKKFDRSYWGFDAAIARHLRPDWVLSAAARYETESFRTVGNHEITYFVSLQKSLSVHLRVALRLQRYRYQPSTPQTSFNDNQIGLRVIYRLTGN
jgi:hypothetical protein